MEINKLVIQRSRWARRTEGIDKGDSALLNDRGCMCCLGFLGEAIGIDLVELGAAGSPAETVSYPMKETSEILLSTWPKAFAPAPEPPTGYMDSEEPNFIDSDITNEAININDHSCTTDQEKEEALTILFAEAGVTLTFED